jgi:hypothetical protein
MHPPLLTQKLWRTSWFPLSRESYWINHLCKNVFHLSKHEGQHCGIWGYHYTDASIVFHFPVCRFEALFSSMSELPEKSPNRPDSAISRCLTSSGSSRSGSSRYVWFSLQHSIQGNSVSASSRT